MKNAVLIVGLCLVLGRCNTLLAQDTVIALSSLLDTVTKRYPEILQYQKKQSAYLSRAEGTKSWMPPTISAGLDQFPYNPMMLSENPEMNRSSVMISIEQMIPNPVKRKAERSYLESLGNIQRFSADWTANGLKQQARMLYFTRFVAERKLVIIRENESVLELLIASAEAKYTYNKAELTSVFKARAKLAELQNMKTMLAATIREANVGINTLLLRDPLTDFTIDAASVTIDSAALNDQVSLQRPDLLAMEGGIESMQKEKAWMASARYPDFGIQFNHMQMIGMDNQYSLMGMITVPVAPWASRMWKSDVKATEFEIQSMQDQLAAMRLMTTRMINERKVMFSGELAQLRNYEREILPAYEKNFDANLVAYKENTGNFFVLLDSWEMLLMKQMEAQDKLLSALTQQTELYYELGK